MMLEYGLDIEAVLQGVVGKKAVFLDRDRNKSERRDEALGPTTAGQLKFPVQPLGMKTLADRKCQDKILFL